MVALTDAFRDPASRVIRTVVAVDLTNSTSMKDQEADTAWLPFYGWFFQMLRETLPKHRGTLVKFLGDGALAIFGEDHAHDGINWAIEVQEAMADAQQNRHIPRTADCSIGIAFGDMVEFDTLDETVDATTLQRPKDYVGSVVDKAFRLCSAANAKAIFADAETISAATMPRVHSKAGAIPPRRSSSEYRGPEAQVTVKGFSGAITYHEIYWANARFGVSLPFVTTLSVPAPTIPAPLPPGVPGSAPAATSALQATLEPAVGAGWLRGTVVTLKESFGFIKANDGPEEFWYNRDQLFRKELQPKLGDKVWFIPRGALPNARNRRASYVLPFGAALVGRVERLNPKGFGFLLCETDRGESKQIFVFFRDVENWKKDQTVTVTVGENRSGIAGLDPR